MKYYTVIFTPHAERQLDSLYMYIAQESGEARADNYVSGIVADCMSLTVFPERGTQRDDIRPSLRIKNYARHVTIAFSVSTEADIVVIHGVFYGGRDFESLLRDDTVSADNV